MERHFEQLHNEVNGYQDQLGRKHVNTENFPTQYHLVIVLTPFIYATNSDDHTQ